MLYRGSNGNEFKNLPIERIGGNKDASASAVDPSTASEVPVSELDSGSVRGEIKRIFDVVGQYYGILTFRATVGSTVKQEGNSIKLSMGYVKPIDRAGNEGKILYIKAEANANNKRQCTLMVDSKYDSYHTSTDKVYEGTISSTEDLKGFAEALIKSIDQQLQINGDGVVMVERSVFMDATQDKKDMIHQCIMDAKKVNPSLISQNLYGIEPGMRGVIYRVIDRRGSGNAVIVDRNGTEDFKAGSKYEEFLSIYHLLPKWLGALSLSTGDEGDITSEGTSLHVRDTYLVEPGRPISEVKNISLYVVLKSVDKYEICISDKTMPGGDYLESDEDVIKLIKTAIKGCKIRFGIKDSIDVVRYYSHDYRDRARNDALNDLWRFNNMTSELDKRIGSDYGKFEIMYRLVDRDTGEYFTVSNRGVDERMRSTSSASAPVATEPVATGMTPVFNDDTTTPIDASSIASETVSTGTEIPGMRLATFVRIFERINNAYGFMFNGGAGALDTTTDTVSFSFSKYENSYALLVRKADNGEYIVECSGSKTFMRSYILEGNFNQGIKEVSRDVVDFVKRELKGSDIREQAIAEAEEAGDERKADKIRHEAKFAAMVENLESGQFNDDMLRNACEAIANKKKIEKASTMKESTEEMIVNYSFIVTDKQFVVAIVESDNPDRTIARIGVVSGNGIRKFGNLDAALEYIHTL